MSKSKKTSSKKTSSSSAESRKRAPGGRFNSVRDGIFAREVLLPGEEWEEFDRLWSQAVQDFQPQHLGDELLLNEAVTSFWLAQRVRRCKAAEIEKRMARTEILQKMDEMDELDSLQSDFWLAHSRLFHSQNLPPDERLEMERSLAEIRGKLENRSDGIDFLLEEIESVRLELSEHGFLRPHFAMLMENVGGRKGGDLSKLHPLNALARNEAQKRENGHHDSEKPAAKMKEPGSSDDPLAMLKDALSAANAARTAEREGSQSAAAEAVGERPADIKWCRQTDQNMKADLESVRKTLMPLVLAAVKRRCAQNTADEDADPNFGGAHLEALLSAYALTEEIIKDIQCREEQAQREDAESGVKNRAEEMNPSAFLLSGLIDHHARRLRMRQSLLKKVEATERECDLSLTLLSPEEEDRFQRAETPHKRHLLKVFQMLKEG